MCENEESEEEKKIIIVQQNNTDKIMNEAYGNLNENIKQKIKREKSVDAEAFCNCGDCLYKHHTIESDENFTE
jgi:uncharacterized protein YecT (DUF1311 family)